MCKCLGFTLVSHSKYWHDLHFAYLQLIMIIVLISSLSVRGEEEKKEGKTEWLDHK